MQPRGDQDQEAVPHADRRRAMEPEPLHGTHTENLLNIADIHPPVTDRDLPQEPGSDAAGAAAQEPVPVQLPQHREEEE